MPLGLVVGACGGSRAFDLQYRTPLWIPSPKSLHRGYRDAQKEEAMDARTDERLEDPARVSWADAMSGDVSLRRLLDAKEVADLLRVSRDLVLLLARQGDLPSVRIGTGSQ